jgi:hypothetical protein
MFQIEVPKRASSCCKGGEIFLPGAEYFSVLVKCSDEMYRRQDYCLTCWESNGEISKNAASSWRSSVPLKKEGSELPKQRDARAFYLLKEATSSPYNDASIAEAFVLSLYLARRRLICLRQEIHQEGKLPLCLYEVAETEEMLCVPKISISDLQVEIIQIELAKKFNAK